MLHLSDLLAFTLMLGAVSAVRSDIARAHLLKAGGKSEGPRDPAGDLSTTTLALGEPCGVYTLSCAKGLRCMPSAQETSPLQALLQGRGICTKGGRPSPPERPHPTGMARVDASRLNPKSMSGHEGVSLIYRWGGCSLHAA